MFLTQMFLTQTQLLLFVAIVSVFALITIIGAALFTVEQRSTAIIQRLGKFLREAEPGLRLKIPFLDRVVGRVNLRVQQLDVEIETKTEDNVFLRIFAPSIKKTRLPWSWKNYSTASKRTFP